jgi:hypothetical protein
MPIHRQPRLIPVTEVAESTGRSADELRRWCAVGRLRGERIDGEWHLLEEDLHVAATLTEMETTSGERVVVSMAYRDEATARQALDRLEARVALGDAGLAIAPMALDGTELTLVAGRVPVERLPDVLSVTHQLGGTVIDGVDAARVGNGWRTRRNSEDEGRSRFG